jgi:N6-adenosine-specific RNA methylase IME4
MAYQTLPIAEIAQLPIEELADEHCLLLMWTTNQFLPEALGLVRLWKFQYDKLFTWCKNNGMGGTPRNATEHLILASRGRPGKPETQGASMVLNWIKLPRTNRHSEKPKELRYIIEKFTAEPKIELFARARHPGWDAWGNEVESDVELSTPNTALTGGEAVPSNGVLGVGCVAWHERSGRMVRLTKRELGDGWLCEPLNGDRAFYEHSAYLSPNHALSKTDTKP